MRIVICNIEVFQNWFKRSTLVSLIFLYEIEIEFKSHIVLLNAALKCINYIIYCNFKTITL